MSSLPVFRGGAQVAVALVDADDAGRLGGYRWNLSGKGYVYRSCVGGGSVALHREVMGCEVGDGLEVDHMNRDKLDCQRSNLRIATRQQNAQNLGAVPGSSSRFRGVGWSKARRCWQVYCQVGGRRVKLGYRKDELEAALLAEEGRRRLMPFALPDPELVAALAAA